MKALSIKQPYAGLIVAGIKNIENRSWDTKFRGPLAIVSTKEPAPARWWLETRAKVARLGRPFPEQLCAVNGSILGIVDLTATVYLNDLNQIETDHPTLEDFEWWSEGMAGFILEYPRALDYPIPMTGRLGLYNLPAEVERAIMAQLAK